MQMMASTVLAQPWLGVTPRQGPVLFLEAEDGEELIHYRMDKILRHYDSSFAAVRPNCPSDNTARRGHRARLLQSPSSQVSSHNALR